MKHENALPNKSVPELSHNAIAAWVVLVVTLTITALGWFISNYYVERRAADRFAFEVEDARERIISRMLEYEQMLRGGVALFNTLGREATRAEWHSYTDDLQIQTHFPGVQGIGYAKMLTPATLLAHVASVRAEGFADYTVTPKGVRDTYSAIVYLEPFDWRNQRAFGYDMYSDPVRGAAMAHARDTDSPAVSSRVVLVQETMKDLQAGFLVYLPVYERGKPLETVEQRRAALSGFVYSPFRMADLMSGILGSDTPEVGFEIYDGAAEQVENTLLYDSAASAASSDPAHTRVIGIALPGREWTAKFYSTPAFEADMASNLPRMVAFGGLLVGALLFAIIWSLSTERRRVSIKVTAMTAGIRQANERLNLAQDAARIGTWDLDLRRGELVWDARMYQLYDTDPAEFTSDLAAWQRRVHPDDQARAEAELQHAIETVGKFDSVFRIIDRAGKIHYIEAHGAVHADESGQARRMVGVNLDITDDRREAEQKLLLAASVFDHAHDAIMITDASQRIIDVNPAFSLVTGFSHDEVLGQTPAVLQSGEHDDAFYDQMYEALRSEGVWRGEIVNRRKSGESFAQMATISAIKDSQGETVRYISVFADITRLVEQQKKLEHMAHYDALTGLPNRVLLADRIAHAMAYARRNHTLLAVCYLDLDGFKPVNDRFGHAAGDELLIDISGRLKQRLRDCDSVARLGGDEFVVLLGDVDDLSACECALDRLLESLTDTYNVAGGSHVEVSASIGVTLYPLDDVDADALLRHADQAMYRAKEEGRGRYHVFDSEQNRQLMAHRQTLTRIRAGLLNNEFVLHYQPKVNMRTGQVVGAEALLRWNHPERGLLPPFEFLPIVEKDDLAISIGIWVIGQVLRQQSEWLREGLKTPVSINVSARHLQQQGFAADLEQQLQTHADVPASLIELEVLETTALDDISQVSKIIAQCRQLGVGVSLDDFGTGYSSLTYLKRLPADTLKIDRSFVRDMLSNAEDLAIVEGIVGLSSAFRRQVIAEGVETEHHGKLLLRLGCTLAQGFGIARPMPADQLAGWITRYQPPPSWHDTPANHWLSDDLPLYAAQFQFDQLVDHLVASLQQSEVPFELPIALTAAQARFSNWYEGEGVARYGHLDEFAAIAPVHQALHQLIDNLREKQRAGAVHDAQDTMRRLLDLRSRLFERIDVLQATLDALGDEARPRAAQEKRAAIG